jgi:hypothetical protein
MKLCTCVTREDVEHYRLDESAQTMCHKFLAMQSRPTHNVQLISSSLALPGKLASLPLRGLYITKLAGLAP